MNIVFQRILTDRHKLEYFERELEMPVSDALLRRRRSWASSDNRLAFRSPELAGFRDWVQKRGYAGYQRYLLDNFALTTAEANRNFGTAARADFARFGRWQSISRAVDPLFVSGPAAQYPRVAMGVSGAAALIAFVFGARRARTLAILIAVGFACAISQAYVCYHADAMETERHSLMVGVVFRLALVTTPFALAAAVLEHRRRRRGRRPLG